MLDGKVVAVTGAGRGIGRCIAIDCAAAGAKVVVADYGVEMDGSDADERHRRFGRRRDQGCRWRGHLPRPTRHDDGRRRRGRRRRIDEWGYFDGVVCVAGILRERMLFNMSEDEWDDGASCTSRARSPCTAPPPRTSASRASGSLDRFTSGVWALGASGSPTTRGQGRHRVVLVLRSAAVGDVQYACTPT